MKNKILKTLFFVLLLCFGINQSNANNNYIIYVNNNDGQKLYKKNANDISDGTAINNVISYNPSYSPDGQYIIYANNNDGGKLYRKNANDISDGTAINNVYSYDPIYSPDGQYIIYANNNDGGKLYRKNANDISDGTAINNVYSYDPIYSPNGQYIIYVNTNDGWKLYKKDANDISDGTAINNVMSYKPSYSPNGQYIIYVNINDGWKLYKKDANDISNGTAINNVMSYNPSYSPDGQYIIYANNNDGGKLYRKNANDISDGTAINNVYSYDPSYSPIINIPINGSCGTNATTYNYNSIGFTGTLCSAGISNPTNPSFPSPGSATNRVCNGINGGTSASCTATRGVAIITNGSCGTNATTYNYNSIGFTGTLCSAGISNPTNPSFPSPGSATNRVCNGINGGTSASCTATRGVAIITNGSCGTNAINYNYDDTNFIGTLCSAGISNPTNPSFPSPGSATNRVCNGINGGTSASCTATRDSEANGTNFFTNFFTNLGNKFDSIIEFLRKMFDFSFEYTGFNFEIKSMYKIITINGLTKNIKPLTASGSDCNTSFTTTLIWYNNSKGGAPDCNDITMGNYPNGAFDYVFQGSNYDGNNDGWLSISYNDFSKYQSYFDNLYRNWPNCYEYQKGVAEKKFNYINSNLNDYNFFVINYNIFNNLNLIPFKITIVGFTFTDYFNLIINKFFTITLEIFSIPLEMINQTTHIYSMFNLKFEKNTDYCFAGGIWHMPNTSTPAISINTNQVPGSTENGQNILMFFILAFVSIVTFKRLKKSI